MTNGNMTTQERFRKAFSGVHASSGLNLNERNMRTHFNLTRPAATAAALICIAGCIGTATQTRKIISRFSTWGDNAEILKIDQDGTPGTEVHLHTDDLTPPAKVTDGRLYFVASGQMTDITDSVSTGLPYIFKETDNGVEHYLVVGLNDDSNLANFGFAEYYRADGNVTGYSAMTNTGPDGKGLGWLETAKKRIGADTATE